MVPDLDTGHLGFGLRHLLKILVGVVTTDLPSAATVANGSSAITVTVFLFFACSFLFTSHSNFSDLNNLVSNSGRYGSVRRSVLALKSDPPKPRLDQIRKQADNHCALGLIVCDLWV
ncbi:hypothetical protein Q3G72_025520 [Acer saccharum]|nr:hypothetical protein Q3G72_025520 [Acer saccharum]